MKNRFKPIPPLTISTVIRFVLITLLLIPGLGRVAKAQQKRENTLLWEISGKGLKKPSYLFGTYHLADKGFADTMKTLNKKLVAADAIVGEITMDKSMSRRLIPYMFLKNTSLDKLLTAEEYRSVADYFKRVTNYELKNYNTYNPASIQLLIQLAVAPKTFTADNPAIDQYFQDYGRTHQKKVMGLENIEEHALLLFGSTLEKQKEQLLKSIKDREKAKKQSNKLYQLYINQNLNGLAKLLLNSPDFTGEERDRILKNRNLRWIAQLPSLMQTQSLFIAVGAGHLVGNDGLIKGLQAKGYTVKPLPTN